MSLKSYCEENNKMNILREWDAEKKLPIAPDAVAHTSGWARCRDVPPVRAAAFAPPQRRQRNACRLF